MIAIMRWVAALIAASSVQCAAAASMVDLDDGAALSRLAIERPEHYGKVVRILEDAQRLPEQEVIGWLRTSYQADDPVFGPTLTSYPPQRRLSFSLDTVRYRATVFIVTPPAVLVPAR